MKHMLLFLLTMSCACKRIDIRDNEERVERFKVHCVTIRSELRIALHDLDRGNHDVYDGLQALNWEATMLCVPKDIEPPKQCVADDIPCMTTNVAFALSLINTQ